jgi:hypothetical protein
LSRCRNEFGFGGAGIPQSFFEKRGSAVHLGVEPNRIDLLTNLKDMDLDDVFERAVPTICAGGLYILAHIFFG